MPNPSKRSTRYDDPPYTLEQFYADVGYAHPPCVCFLMADGEYVSLAAAFNCMPSIISAMRADGDAIEDRQWRVVGIEWNAENGRVCAANGTTIPTR